MIFDLKAKVSYFPPKLVNESFELLQDRRSLIEWRKLAHLDLRFASFISISVKRTFIPTRWNMLGTQKSWQVRPGS